MRDKVLIVTSKEDEHADYIIQKCNCAGRGDKLVRLNTEDFLSNARVSFDGFRFEIFLSDSGRRLCDDEIKTVWYRRPLPARCARSQDPGAANFATEQAGAFLKGLYACTHSTSMWINPLPANLFAKNKLYQLHQARLAGLRVPKVLITNDASKAWDFSVQEGRLCNKSLTVPRYTLHNTVYPYLTRLVGGPEEIFQHADAVSLCPTFFEEYIEKAFDVRVVAFQDQLYAFEIDSQAQPLSSVDVRGIEPSQLRHRSLFLPGPIREKVLDFLHRQKLIFSSMDFVVTAEGEYFFIENNCNGQWLWLEYLTGVPMSDSFIRLLFTHAATE